MPFFLTSHEKKALLLLGALALGGSAVLGWRHWKKAPAPDPVEMRRQARQRIEDRDRKLDLRPIQPILDLNQARERDLLRIPTVGNATAARIVQYRRLNGRFGDIAELERVPGIGKKRCREIAPYVYVVAPTAVPAQAAQPGSPKVIQLSN